jgi:trans-aconitate 2-methyltransferase
MTWDPSQYDRFRAERSQPFFDLVALVAPAAKMRAIDLGSGTGELTRELHRRLGCTTTTGYERSRAMLEASAKFVEPGLSFEEADIGALDLAPKSVDLVFANASLHWLPDHRTLFRKLTGWLAEGGQLAVQVPANFDHPSHMVAADIAREEPFATALRGFVHSTNVLDPSAYAELLHDLGFGRQHVRLVVYTHLLPSPDAVVEWVKGTLLTAYRERLDAPTYESFVDAYRARLLLELSHESPFFFPFKRILMWAMHARAAALDS